MSIEPSIIVAGIVSAGTIVTQLIIARGNRKTATETNKAAMDLFSYRIGQLEEKVMKHNSLVERLTLCEASTKSAHHRIDEIKN